MCSWYRVLNVVLFTSLLVGCSFGEGSGTAGPRPGGEAVQGLLPGIVLDGGRSRAYLRAADGFLSAVDLRDGNTIWKTEATAEPILLVGERLAIRRNDPAAKNRFRVGWVDPATGEPAGADSGLIELPGWVSVGVARGRSFHVLASIADTHLVLEWHARSWYASGAAPNSQMRAREKRQTGGVVVVDPQSEVIEQRGIAPPGADSNGSAPYWTAGRPGAG